MDWLRFSNPSDEERRRAVAFVLNALRHPLMLISKPDREEAERLAALHNVTALDLLALASRRARDA